MIEVIFEAQEEVEIMTEYVVVFRVPGKVLCLDLSVVPGVLLCNSILKYLFCAVLCMFYNKK